MTFNNFNKHRVGGTDSKMELAVRPPSVPAGRICAARPFFIAAEDELTLEHFLKRVGG